MPRAAGARQSFWDESRRSFFEINAAAMLAAGWLHLSFLELNGRRAATIYAYDYGDTMGLYNSGYDPAHSYFSVGVLLVALGVQEAIAAGKRRFDFLRGSEPYKYTFGAVDTAVFNVEITKALNAAAVDRQCPSIRGLRRFRRSALAHDRT